MAAVIAVDGVSGVGKTTFLEYVRNYTSYKVIVPKYYFNENNKCLERAWVDAWISVLYVIRKYQNINDIVFLDRSPASFEVYQKDFKDMIYFLQLYKKNLPEIFFYSVLFNSTLDRIKLNKGLNKKETSMDYCNLTTHKASLEFKKAKVWGNGWDLIVDPYSYRRHKGRLLNKILTACDVC